MLNLGKLEYLPEFNRTRNKKKGQEILAKYGADAIMRCLKAVLEDVVMKGEGGDVTLCSFIMCPGEANYYFEHETMCCPLQSDAVIAFPKYGKVEYKLKGGCFFTNVHRNPSILVVRDIWPAIYLRPEVQASYFSVDRGDSVGNVIKNALLINENPLKLLKVRELAKELVGNEPT